MDPIIGAGFIGGASSLLSSGLNVIGASSTNNSSKHIANMNNRAMIDMMREQTRLEQDYNSIGSQMKRAMAAGVSPMLLAGAQPTSASSSAVPNLDSPNLQNPFNAVDLGGSSIANAMIQSQSLANQEKSLDIQDFESTIKMLEVVGDLAKSGALTSENINDMISKYIKPGKQASLGPLVNDQWIKTKIANAIEVSNLEKDEKKYLFGWLDEFTNARFTNLLADIEGKQTNSLVNRSQAKLNKALQSMNEEKKKEITQAIKNMKEQWKSLNALGEIDVHKVKRAAEISDAVVQKIVQEANLTTKEAQMVVFNWMADMIPG